METEPKKKKITGFHLHCILKITKPQKQKTVDSRMDSRMEEMGVAQAVSLQWEHSAILTAIVDTQNVHGIKWQKTI